MPTSITVLYNGLGDSLSRVEATKLDLSKKAAEFVLPSPKPGPVYTIALGPGGIGLWRGSYNGNEGGYEWFHNAR